MYMAHAGCAKWVWHSWALSVSYSDHYMAYAGWVNGSHAYVAWLNRDQNYIEFCSYGYPSVECDMVCRDSHCYGCFYGYCLFAAQVYNYSVPEGEGWIEQVSK